MSQNIKNTTLLSSDKTWGRKYPTKCRQFKKCVPRVSSDKGYIQSERKKETLRPRLTYFSELKRYIYRHIQRTVINLQILSEKYINKNTKLFAHDTFSMTILSTFIDIFPQFFKNLFSVPIIIYCAFLRLVVSLLLYIHYKLFLRSLCNLFYITSILLSEASCEGR